MRKVYFTFFVLLAVVLALVAYLRLHGTNGSEPASEQSERTTSPGNANSATPSKSRNPTTNTVEAAPQQTVEQATESLHAVATAWTNQIQKAISFFGKVVDEQFQPVQAAQISLICSQYAPENSFETNVTSDANGLFSVTGLTGGALSVKVAKAGYFTVKTNQTHFQYWEMAGSVPFQPDPGNPVVFYLRKKGKGADLVTATLNVKISSDGTPVKVDLLNKLVGDDGQLQLSQEKPPYATWKKATAWSFRMAIPDGGFIEQDDEFPFQAPQSGYQPTIEFNFQQGQAGWATDMKKTYYIKFGTPSRYGWLTVVTDISWSGARLTYSVNPDGSSNLEPAN